MTPAPALAYIEGEGLQLEQTPSQLLEHLYIRYKAPLLSLCAFWLKDDHLAQDVVHDAILKAALAMHSYNPTKPIWPWLLTIAKRACIDHLRRSLTTVSLDNPQAQTIKDSTDSTYDLVELRTEAHRLHKNLKLLPTRQKRALLLHTLEDWTYPEIAATENISIKAARQLVVRARKNLTKNSRP